MVIRSQSIWALGVDSHSLDISGLLLKDERYLQRD